MVNRGYLLDTHVFLWWLADDGRLSKKSREILGSSREDVFLSVVSIWEIVIKMQAGKLKFVADLEKLVKESGFKLLTMELRHVLQIEKLPLHHKDPFDRMLISQALVEGLCLMSSDPVMEKYEVEVV